MLPNTSHAQPFIADDNDVSIFIDDIWEHKVTLSIAWKVQRPCKRRRLNDYSDTTILYGKGCLFDSSQFGQRNVSDTTHERADKEARMACGYYKRDAVGPINVSRSNGTAHIFRYTYACSIR